MEFWKKSRALKEYLKALKKKPKMTPELEEYIELGQNYADRLNPLNWQAPPSTKKNSDASCPTRFGDTSYYEIMPAAWSLANFSLASSPQQFSLTWGRLISFIVRVRDEAVIPNGPGSTLYSAWMISAQE